MQRADLRRGRVAVGAMTAVVVLAGLVGCADDTSTVPVQSSPGSSENVEPGTSETADPGSSGTADPGSSGTADPASTSITSGGTERTFELVRPPGVTVPAPLVIMLHGSQAAGLGRGLRGALGLDELASANGVVTVYPDGELAIHSWHIGCCYDGAADQVDVRFVTDLIDHLVETGVADPQHVVVGGFSAGAFLAAELACQVSDKISGVIALAGSQTRPPAFADQVVSPAIEPCTPRRPVSRLSITGTDDGAVPFEGSATCAADPCGPGQRGYLAPTATVDEWWRTLDGCQPPVEGSAGSEATTSVTSLASCRDGTVVGHAQVGGAGHSVAELRDGFDIDQAIVDLALGKPPSAWTTS